MRVRRLLLLGVVLVLLIGGVVAWMERATLHTWWVLRGLQQASETERSIWITRIAELSDPPVDGLLDCLGREDERACQNSAAALNHLALTWGPDDPRTVDLAGKLARSFGKLCPRGQCCLLTSMSSWLTERPPSSGFVSACSRLLAEAASGDEETQCGGLDLAAALLRHPHCSEAMRSARELARAALRSANAANKVRAIRLGLLPGVDLLREIVALLSDPAAEVRRAAILAVGPADQVVRDEGLLPSLHDPDAEVRRLTQEALRARGLRPEHLKLGWLLTHPSAKQRLGVLDHLGENQDLDPGLWLRRLSHDPSPAVRSAALRVMSEQRLIDLSDRIDQIARSDPSPTVAEQAKYYLRRRGAP